jgi:predicted MPP superfamily phosphohydrolase
VVNLRIVHLSDTHFDPKKISSFQNNIVEPLIRDLKMHHQETPIDLICFTGDLVDKGGNGEIKLALENFKECFIKRIANELQLPIERFPIIPGNHEVEKSKVHNILDKTLVDILKDDLSIDETMINPTELNLERLEGYFSFQKEYFSHVKEIEYNPYGYALKLNIRGKLVGIAGINSSWRCSGSNDRSNLVIGRRQIEPIIEYLKDDDYHIKIAMLHHPYDYLVESDKDRIESILTREFDLILSGHIHRSNSHMYQNSLGEGTIYSGAPSNWVDNIYHDEINHCNGYTIIDFDVNGGQAILTNRRYSKNRLKYVPNADISQNVNEGTSVFRLPSNEARQNWERQADAISKIKSNHLPALNEKLLVYNTDTVAPKDLETIFVLPNIEIKKVKEEDKDLLNEEKKEYLNLETISLSNENLFLIGSKESGKTTILYRLLQYVTKNSFELKTIPVYIDLNKSELNTHVETEISLFLGVNRQNVNEILSSNRVLLLLDNVTFNKRQENFLNRVTKLLEINKNIVAIATAEQTGEEVPLGFFAQSFFKACTLASIKNFQSEQIRSLIKKWFSKDEDKSLREKLEGIVESFHSLNIPTTPLAVSLFLWILEKQEEYIPKNNALMLENFIEKLLRKHSVVEVKSEDFHYWNQIKLLIHIALKMFEEGNTNYRLRVFDLKSTIVNHFKEVGWTPAPLNKKPYYDWIPDYFLSVGLFILEEAENDTYIKFRLNCFFQFFLMQNIDNDESKFRELVFHEEHYLEFFSEIDYYTALHRDKTDALKRVVTLMDESFKSDPLIKKVTEYLNEHSIDEVFRNQKSHIKKFKSEQEMEKFIQEIKKTEEEENQINDLKLDNGNDLNNSQIPTKDSQSTYSPMKILEQSWLLAAMVLKNSEDSKDSLYKEEAYRLIFKHSLTFMCLYQILMNKQIEKEPEQNKTVFEFLARFLQPIHQTVLFNYMGTSKLGPIFKKILDEMLENKIKDVGLVEKFTALFMYTDLHPEDEEKYLKRVIPSMVKGIVRDFIFMKLSQYESKNLDDNSFYPELLKVFIHSDVSNRNKPLKQRNQGLTKRRIDRKRLIERSKKKSKVDV